MANNTTKTHRGAITNQRDAVRPEFRVSDPHQFDDGNVTFRLHYGRCTIYGCRIAQGESGEFIAFPSRKVEGKRRGDAPRWFSHAYIPLDEAEQVDIINMVYDQLDADKAGHD